MADEHEDDEPKGPSLSSLKAQLKSATARIAELNEEAKGHRLNANEARAELEKLRPEMERAVKEAAEKTAAAEKAMTDAGVRVAEALRDAAVRVAAKDAGILDIDGLKLFDLSDVKVGEDGAVTIPPKFFEEAKAAKPYLFSQTGADVGTTSSTAKPPAASDTKGKTATEMTPEEYRAARAALVGR
jgi:putative heme iron utilization protein